MQLHRVMNRHLGHVATRGCEVPAEQPTGFRLHEQNVCPQYIKPRGYNKLYKPDVNNLQEQHHGVVTPGGLPLQLRDVVAESDSLAAKLANVSAQRDALRHQREAAGANIEELAAQLSAAVAESDSLAAQLASVTADREAVRQRATDASAAMDTLAGQLCNAVAERDRLVAKVSELTAETEGLRVDKRRATEAEAAWIAEARRAQREADATHRAAGEANAAHKAALSRVEDSKARLQALNGEVCVRFTHASPSPRVTTADYSVHVDAT